MLDGAGSAGQPGWASRVSLPLQQTGATRTIVSNPRPIGPRLLCAYPFTPARQTLTHPAQLHWSPGSAARASPPLSARLAASGRADAERTPQCCCSPSSCACNAALSGRPRACSCCTSIANTRLGQSAPAPPAYAPSATRRVPSFHTRFDHARSGLIDRQPMTSSQSVDSARLSFQRIGDADSSNAT
jgi:hypothetical protein